MDSAVVGDRLISYRGSVALNNLGVSLLTQGNYKNALSVFKEAISFIKPCERGLPAESELELLSAAATPPRKLLISSIESRIRDASTKLITHRKNYRADNVHLTLANSSSSSSVVVLTYYGGYGLKYSEWETAAETIAYPVRVELEDMNTFEPSDDEIEIFVAVLLHNIAATNIAFYASIDMNRSESPMPSSPTFNAMRSLRLAQTMLGAIQFFSDRPNEAPSEGAHLTGTFSCAMQLEAVVLQCLIPILQAHGETWQANICTTRFCALLQSLQPTSIVDCLAKANGAGAA